MERIEIGQLSCILFLTLGGKEDKEGVFYTLAGPSGGGSYQRIYDLFPTARTLFGTMLGSSSCSRSARVITRGKLSTDTAAGRSTCRSFRSVNENETSRGTRAREGHEGQEGEGKGITFLDGCARRTMRRRRGFCANQPAKTS